MRVGFDVDDVIADLLPAWLDSYNKEHGTKWTVDQLTRWDFQNDLGCSYDDLLKHLQPTLYDVIKPCEGALEVVNQVRAMGHEIAFISSSHDLATWEAKVKWIMKEGFISPVSKDLLIPVGSWCEFATKREAGEKFEIKVFVDDHIGNIEGWPGSAYLLTRPHNQRLIYPGKRLKKLSDLLLELKYWPKSVIVNKEPILRANESGWVGGTPKLGQQDQGTDFWLKPLPEGSKPSNPKDIIGSDKMPFHLWPETATIYGTLGMLEGALKYGRGNFRAVGVRASIYIDAARRHLNAWASGEENAEDSGLPHLGHALACIAILVEAIAQGNLQDDRDFKGEAYLKMLKEMTPEVKRLKEKYKDSSPKHYTIADRSTNNQEVK